jgi:membrane fusion protein (multidrug efflux system)
MNTPATPPSGAASVTVDPAERRRRRRTGLLGLGVLALGGLAAGIWWVAVGQYRETTEDAYVDGNVVAVTAQVSGVVTAIAADDTDYVSAGTPLVVLDDVDAGLAVDRAKAQLARAVRQVRAQLANVGQAEASVQLREVDLAKAKADLARRRGLLASGAISGEEVRHAEDAVRAASAALQAARHQVAASQAPVDRTPLASNPDVLAAATQVRDAWIAAYRTRVPAPVSGLVTRRNVQIGQKINPGVALMSVVPLDQLWVDANFEEGQLRHIRIGQPVRLTADVYGGKVVYTGTVAGQDAGTGSAFSLLPAQNATGNWIKVVQRVPVRIALDPAQVARYPLQVGLSMRVSVSTGERKGSRLAAPGAPGHGYRTDVFAHELASADAVVERIIAANR